MNGTFVLTQIFPGSPQYTGPGNDFTLPDIGLIHTTVTVNCSEEVSLSINYSDTDTGGLIFFQALVFPVPTSFLLIPNQIPDCSTASGHEGTASITWS